MEFGICLVLGSWNLEFLNIHTMKKTFTLTTTGCLAILFAAAVQFAVVPAAMAQPSDETWMLPFMGSLSDHEGVASWDADGSGPEPYGVGHQIPVPGFLNMPYYNASRDYDDIDPDPNAAAAHLTGAIQGFPLFVQALADHGYVKEQVQYKVGLGDLGNDVEGIDWFVIYENFPYSFYYEQSFWLVLDGETIIQGLITFDQVFHPGTWRFETSYFVPDSAWAEDAGPGIKEVGMAFLEDVGDEEIRIIANLTNMVEFEGNGRDGLFYDVAGRIEKGFPRLPYTGLAAEHQGMAGWNADGTGPEPAGDGHGAQRYYTASRDYDDIDPDPNAAFGHFIPQMHGFLNLDLQLTSRNIPVEQLVIKQGLASLGNDIMGLDWGFENGTDYWCNYYDIDYRLELNGEVLIRGLIDTSHSYMNADPVFWFCDVTYDRPKNGAALSSPDAQIIADAFMKDMEARKMINNVEVMTYHTDTFNLNGRYNGGYFNVETASLVFKNTKNCCFVQCDTIGGGMSDHTDWTLAQHPYFIDNDLIIPEGHTLNIEPGVKVAIRGPYKIKVDGRVLAQGTEGNDILFTSSNPLQRWNSITYDYTQDERQSKFGYCTFEFGYSIDNVPYNSGGAFYIDGFSNILFDHCTFRDNQVEKFIAPSGGAMWIKNANPLISHCTFYNNKAKYGGAIACFASASPVIEYCLFYGNHASTDGGAILVYDYCYPTFINNTITGNDAGGFGGGLDIYHSSGDTVYFINNIIYGNTCSETTGQEISLSSENNHIDFQYNDIMYGLDGMGPGAHTYINYAENNIDADPVFCFPEDYIYTLEKYSPCVGAGSGGNFIGAFDWDCYAAVPEKVIKENNLVIYPNPATAGPVNTLFFTPNPGLVRLEIFSPTGEKVAEPVNGVFPTGEHMQTFSVESLPAGIYIFKLTTGNQVKTGKLVITR